MSWRGFVCRSCGVGAQLGYAISRGDFVYVLDGDMQLLPGFLSAAPHRTGPHCIQPASQDPKAACWVLDRQCLQEGLQRRRPSMK